MNSGRARRRLPLVTVLLVHGLLVSAAELPVLGSPPWFARAVIKPSLVRLDPGEEQRFKVVLLATRLEGASVPERVNWSVNGIPGGRSDVGTIDEAGRYRAPPQAPVPGEVHIGAEVDEAANRRLFATVLVGGAEPTYELLWSWAEEDGEEARMEKPHGISLDRDGNLLIADEGAARILRYTPRGEYLGDLGRGPGSEPGQFKDPRETEVDAEGRIFVTDSKGDRPRVQVFTHEGEFLRIFAEKGTGPGMILRGHGLGFDDQQRLFVVDVDNMRVNVYSHGGEFLYSFGEDGRLPGQFNAPHGLVVDPSGDVFVSGYYGPTQKFDSEGHFLFAFGHGDPPDGAIYFHSMSGDRWGNVYLTVRTRGGDQGRIQASEGRRPLSVVKYNNSGDYICGWSFDDPEHRETATVVDDEGRVYCLFDGKDRRGVQVFGPR